MSNRHDWVKITHALNRRNDVFIVIHRY
jgi:hypothetical protein